MTRVLKIMDEDWDNLIILDACRYDYFANMISDYFSGVLEKRVSIGSCTPEWCQKSFQSYYPNVIYVSGNPYINSKVKVAEFDAKKHFYKVADVWAFGWDEKLGTVPPHEINDATLSLIEKYSEKRFIIHYLQPHAPYISQEFFVKGFSNPFTKGPLSGVQGEQTNRTVEGVVNILGALLVKTNIIKNTWELRETLSLPPASPMDAVRRKHGVKGLKEAYKQNLGIVLGYVAELSHEILRNYPSRKVVITADHGELLGEGKRYSHPFGSRDPIVVEIPWFKVKSVDRASYTAKTFKKFDLPVTDIEKERVKDKIRKLKREHKLLYTPFTKERL